DPARADRRIEHMILLVNGRLDRLAHGLPCSDPAGEEFDVETPRRAAVDRDLTAPAKGFLRNLREAPADQVAIGTLAELHDVAALPAADHAEIALRHRIGPLDLPGIDSRIIDPQRRAINVAVGRRIALALGPARRHHPHVLDGAALEHPAEMPLARTPPRRAVRKEPGDVEIPGADQPPVEV